VTFSGTIGQLIMGSKVVNAKQFKEEESEQSINFFKALLRFLSKIILGFITLLTIYSDFYSQAIHDKIAGTIVIKR
jgi:uncharacterized RDD family membrane protein YckC